METSSIIAIVISCLSVLLILKFISKTIIRIISIVIVAITISVFFYAKNNDSEISKLKKAKNYSLEEIKGIYCFSNMTAKEELKCNCIVQPVYNDILSRLSESEIDKMKTNKLKLMTELMKSFNNSKLQIETCLKENNSLELLEEFKKELNSSEILKKIKDK